MVFIRAILVPKTRGQREILAANFKNLKNRRDNRYVIINTNCMMQFGPNEFRQQLPEGLCDIERRETFPHRAIATFSGLRLINGISSSWTIVCDMTGSEVEATDQNSYLDCRGKIVIKERELSTAAIYCHGEKGKYYYEATIKQCLLRIESMDAAEWLVLSVQTWRGELSQLKKVCLGPRFAAAASIALERLQEFKRRYDPLM